MVKFRKGIILAGGHGTRLAPLTSAISKQLMPIYDKPMIYYPISTLMLAGIREINIIVKPEFLKSFVNLLGDGKKWGLNFTYTVQEYPNGLVEGITLSESFINGAPIALILGDNLFHGSSLMRHLESGNSREKGATIFAYRVKDPQRYGVLEFDKKGKVKNITEKPNFPKSNYAATGLYFYDETVSEKAKNVHKSSNGEFEITSLNQIYLKESNLNVELMGRGMAWLDTGTHESLHKAASFIRSLEDRQGLRVSCPEEIAWRKKWINESQLKELAKPLMKSNYGNYLIDLIENPSFDNYSLINS
tara:strand:- start:1504 stop:2415 length:912 start_codon:yes stop_codon:yes gene_type:complete